MTIRRSALLQVAGVSLYRPSCVAARLPNVILEAMASGLPMVARSVPASLRAMSPPPPDRFLRPTPILDFEHPRVRAFVADGAGAADPRRRAVDLYYAVRDGLPYDPYRIDLSVEGLRASTTLALGHGWCVSKAALLAACCRAVGIPARLGYADVRNHLSTPRMRAVMQTDVFFWHGYAELLLEGRWIKATPAFNVELCERFRLRPLEFDGRADSIYHPFDLDGNQHMEYLRDHGWFDDVPIERMVESYEREYPGALDRLARASFERDVSEAVPRS